MESNNDKLSYRPISDGDSSAWYYSGGIDEMTSTGCFILKYNHENTDIGLPMSVCKENHYINAILMVTESGTGDNLQKNRFVGQTLILPQCYDGKTHLYTRTLKCADNLWLPWTKIQQNREVGLVTSLDTYIDSGVYSGTYTDDSLCEAFAMVVIDNEITASTNGNVRSVSQFKYSLNLCGTFSYRVRTGQGNAEINWGEWVDIGAADTTDIQDNSITAQKLSIDVRKKLENVEVKSNGCNDLDFVDADKNCVVRFAEGHIMTKNFDSRKNTVSTEEKTKLKSTGLIDVENCDMAITDEQNNAILVIADGHIKTKKFDSRTGVKETKYIDRDIYALGDSTTQGAGSGDTPTQGSKSWFDRLVAKIQFRSYRKLAANGTTAMKQEGLGALSSQINYLPLVGNPIILIMIGTNDINRAHIRGDVNAVLGMQYEELDEMASFAEAYRYNLETIKRRLPNAEIIAMMPLTPQLNDESGAESYRDIERVICKALSIPVLEVRNECGINRFCNYGFAQVKEAEIENATVFMADALHPNNAGYERIANYIASKLNKYIQ